MSKIILGECLNSKDYFPSRLSYSFDMGKTHIAEIFAKNLERAIANRYELKPDGTANQSALAKDAKVSQKGISNYLTANNPENKDRLDEISSPSILTLYKMAKALHVEPWELLHPNPEKARHEQEFYERIEKDFKGLPKLQTEAKEWNGVDRRQQTERRDQ